MARQMTGVVEDERNDTIAALAQTVGLEERTVRQHLSRYGIKVARMGKLHQISGLHWRLAVVRVAMEQELENEEEKSQ
ncbi:MAG: hypothetical protein AAFU85_30785 [Planctomycetota bacterium]